MIGVPRNFEGHPAAAGALRLNALAVITAACWGAFFLQHLVLGYYRIAAVDLVAGVLVLAARLWAFRGADEQRIHRAGHMVLAVSCAALVAAALLSGQELAMATWYLCAAPLFAGFHMGVRAAIVWTALAVICMTVVRLSNYFFIVPPEYIPDENNLYIGKVILSLIVLGLTVATRRAMNFYTAELNAQKAVIRERATEIAVARDEALDAVKVKDEFLANISHEIRTPLNGIIGMASVMLDSDLAPAQREMVTTIQRSSNTLLAIINEILDFSRLEASARAPEAIPFDLRECVEDVIDMFARDAWLKQIDLATIPHPNAPRWIEGDITYLRQILINLVGNAVKFTDEGGEVVVRVRPVHEGLIEFTVKDTGIGIPEEKINSVFDAFSQVDSSTTRRYGGTGLGLAISKRLVELMGGAIDVSSKAGEGTTFRFTVPANEVPPRVRPTTTRERISLIGHSAAVMGGSAASRESVDTMLASWGMRSVQPKDRPDVLIVFDDPEVEYPRTSADMIALVPVSSKEARQRALEGGADYIVFWPARRRALRDTIEAIIAGPEFRAERPRLLDSEMAQRIPARVLLAEDNPVNQKVATTILQKLGYEPDLAADGATVMDCLDRSSYDILFMDLQMPHLDGLETTRRIREELPQGRQPWIVALTATVGPTERAASFEAGMDDFLGKPFDVQALMAAIERYGKGRSERGPWFELRKMLASRPDKLVELIDLHLENGAELLDTMERAWESEDFGIVRDQAHKLKSAAAQFGSVQVAEKARAIERAAGDEDGPRIEELLPVLRADWELAEQRLSREKTDFGEMGSALG